MSALEALQKMRRNDEPMTDLQKVVLDASYTRDPRAESAAGQLSDLMASLEIYHKTLRKTELQLAEALRVLKDIEYIDVDGSDGEVYPMCPRCGNGTHRKDCELAAALGRQG